jgi:hypothetical protein
MPVVWVLAAIVSEPIAPEGGAPTATVPIYWGISDNR